MSGELSKDSNGSRNVKPSKPFCSLAYLAKSTIAVHGTNDIIGRSTAVNGHSHKNATNGCDKSQSSSSTSTPNVAVTAKVNDRASPSLPTGTNTGHQQIHNANSPSPTCPNNNTKDDGVADVFGVINEEDRTPSSSDQVDNVLRRPWELSNGQTSVHHMPSVGSHQHYNGGTCLPSLSKFNSIDCWDYTIELECLKGPQDLQLAAELGKTLLERNKELETLLKEHKHTIEEQEQEIVYLKKHTTALREVNDSRLKVYEQLEVGIQDLERANHRLLVENTADKKHIKTLSHTIETLEARTEELTKQLDDVRQALTAEKRKNERLLAEMSKNGGDANAVKLKPKQNKDAAENDIKSPQPGYDANTTAPENCSFTFQSPAARNSTGISGTENDSSFDLSMVGGQEGNDEIIKLVNDFEATKKAYMAEQQRCGELEEQLVAIIQENQNLQTRIAQTSATEEMKSMHDELSILDEVRQGQMCSRCLRSMDERAIDEQSSLAPTEECEEDEENSLLDLEGSRAGDNASEHSQAAYRSSMSIKVMPHHPDSLDLHIPGSPNPYRDLVEKYEALLEVQRSSIARKNTNGGLSLAEEFQSSGEFNQTQKLMLQAAQAVVSDHCNASNSGDAASSCNGSMTNDSKNNTKADKNRGRTPTEFSEAETSSSGYSDETSNKATQTDERPGYFLCSIGDGEDCKFSIYDDASPIDSRFRNRPEYRELFKEIFAVLKKAAENKEEGEKLPLLDDTHPVSVNTVQKVPPVTPANEELPVDFGDDTQSIISSAVSEQSFAMSECITKLERKTAKKHIIEKNQENKPPLTASISQLTSPNAKQIIENGRILTPLKREPLDYLAVGVGIKKKNRRKNRNFSSDRSESPLALPTPPRIFVASGKKRKDVRPYVESPMASNSNLNQTTPNSSRGSRSAPKYEWNGNSMIIYNRSLSGRGSRDADVTSIPYRPSTVSQDLHKLKKLDLSYAEVLRRADACKSHNQQQHYHQQQQQQSQRRRNHRH
ncbi:cerebellar degeneration-related protein 2-like isoform X1 [Musca autumnalis]|uniref:cerebellar degeneration-related protein 2-like isoform X1 n=1 Tax=Musca autumnalis TaxID=221902 RepID=UPI003CFB3A82